MGGKEKIGDSQDKTEKGKSFPKVDIEVKNVKVAKEIQKQFEGFVTKTPEWKEIENMKTDAKKLNAEMQKSFNEQFERQVDSGEIVQVLYKIEKDIIVNGPEKTARNSGAGLTLPVQLVLSHVTEVIGADGIAGAQSVGALNKFQKEHNLPITSTFTIDAPTIRALIDAYTKDYREVSKFSPTPEQLKARENKKYKAAIINYFVASHTRPAIEDILPTSQEKSSMGDLIPASQKKEWHDMMRVDGVKTIAFGPSPFGQNTAPWLDVTKLDPVNNPKLSLKVHTNNNFETSFVVDVNDITYTNSRGELKVNPVELYEKTRKALITDYAKKRFNGANAKAIV